jgi:hypothetical protein
MVTYYRGYSLISYHVFASFPIRRFTWILCCYEQQLFAIALILVVYVVSADLLKILFFRISSKPQARVKKWGEKVLFPADLHA